MRAFLLFLAIAVPIVLASPTFWWLVASEYAVAPVGYGREDGSMQPALLGPQAPWPDWALRPEGAELTVSSWFGRSGPTHPATGAGLLAFEGDPRQAAEAYAAALTRAGWRVETSRFAAAVPGLQPQRLESCVVFAARIEGEPRVLLATFDREPIPGQGRITWREGEAPQDWAGVKGGGPC